MWCSQYPLLSSRPSHSNAWHMASPAHVPLQSSRERPVCDACVPAITSQHNTARELVQGCVRCNAVPCITIHRVHACMQTQIAGAGPFHSGVLLPATPATMFPQDLHMHAHRKQHTTSHACARTEPHVCCSAASLRESPSCAVGWRVPDNLVPARNKCTACMHVRTPAVRQHTVTCQYTRTVPHTVLLERITRGGKHSNARRYTCVHAVCSEPGLSLWWPARGAPTLRCLQQTPWLQHE